jgi:uncharacterized protein DUF5993
MMSVPFFVFVAGLAAVLAGWRQVALGTWAIGVVVLLALFRMHASDVLAIGL